MLGKVAKGRAPVGLGRSHTTWLAILQMRMFIMPVMSHEEIVQAFVKAKVVDFAALGKLVSEVGPHIAASGRGDYGVRFGVYNSLICFNPIPVDFRQRVGGAAEMAAEVLGGSD